MLIVGHMNCDFVCYCTIGRMSIMDTIETSLWYSEISLNIDVSAVHKSLGFISRQGLKFVFDRKSMVGTWSKFFPRV